MDSYVTTSLADGLRKIADLRETGTLTEAEFEAAKAEMFVVQPDVFEREVRKLAELLDRGVLAETEFEIAKAQVLLPAPEALNVTAGGSEVYVIPDFLLSRMADASTEFRRRRA